MSAKGSLLPSQRVVRVGLFVVAAIAMIGGPLQMYLGEPETTARLDNVHRFLAGIYWGAGFTGLWAGLTIRKQNTLVFLLALNVFLGGIGRVVSILHVGLPAPSAVWLGYLIPELLVPVVIVCAQLATNRSLRNTPQKA